MDTGLSIKGFPTIRKIGFLGNVLQEISGENLVVIGGFVRLARVINREMSGSEILEWIDEIKVSDGGGTESNLGLEELFGDTIYSGETSLERFNNELVYSHNFQNITTQQSVNEYGLFGGGVLIARFTSPFITLFPDQSLEINWSIRVGQA